METVSLALCPPFGFSSLQSSSPAPVPPKPAPTSLPSSSPFSLPSRPVPSSPCPASPRAHLALECHVAFRGEETTQKRDSSKSHRPLSIPDSPTSKCVSRGFSLCRTLLHVCDLRLIIIVASVSPIVAWIKRHTGSKALLALCLHVVSTRSILALVSGELGRCGRRDHFL